MKTTDIVSSLVLTASIACTLATNTPRARAADHADSPALASDQGADLADVYFFQDPADATKVVVINTLRGFIVPGEAVNFAIFDPVLRLRFEIENTGDAKPDAFIDVQFSDKTTSAPQTASIKFSGSAFTGLPKKANGTATAASLAPATPANYFPAVPQKLTSEFGEIGVEFFAGEVDDPFFFDIPGFSRFRTKAIANDPKAGDELKRGRDTFAGYNVMAIAFRLPIAALKSTKADVTNATKFGVSVSAHRGTERISKGGVISTGPFKGVDRMGNPAVNAVLIPLAFKKLYNGGTPQKDAEGAFVGALLEGLKDFGIITAEDPRIATLAGVAVTNGDILRLDTAVPAGFPNGRKLTDDVVDTLLSIIADADLGDSVDGNEKPLEAIFPYLGLPHQPRTTPADDQTQN